MKSSLGGCAWPAAHVQVGLVTRAQRVFGWIAVEPLCAPGVRRLGARQLERARPAVDFGLVSDRRCQSDRRNAHSRPRPRGVRIDVKERAQVVQDGLREGRGLLDVGIYSRIGFRKGLHNASSLQHHAIAVSPF